jgi:hypothetical protein
MIQGQLWAQVGPETSDMAFTLLDMMAKTMADKMNCDIGERVVGTQTDSPELIVWWPLTPRP